MKHIRKALVACAGVAAVFGTVAADGAISAQDGLMLAAAVATAYGVWRVPNDPKEG